MSKVPPPLGTVNGYIASVATLNGKRFVFDGTTVGLVNSAVEAGATPGDVLTAWFGTVRPHPRDPGRKEVVTETGGGDRTPNGWWADRPRCECGWVFDQDGVCLSGKH